VSETFLIRQDDGQHDLAVEALYARAFGPGRFAKAAARLREGNICQRDASFLAFKGPEVVGACRLWPIAGASGGSAMFLGPIAVDTSVRSEGLGRRLVEACLARGDHFGPSVVFLVGDLAYFARMGFSIIPTGQVRMPGPVDPNRFLWRVKGIGTEDLPSGLLRVARA
jgi:predicted N-acetyltransferase YhbS